MVITELGDITSLTGDSSYAVLSGQALRDQAQIYVDATDRLEISGTILAAGEGADIVLDAGDRIFGTED